jgi:hypothetical protein
MRSHVDCYSGWLGRIAGLVLVAAAVSGCTAGPESQSPPSTTDRRAEPKPAEQKPADVNAAVFVTQTVPWQMIAGRDYQASITMRNTGTMAWTLTGNYRLGTQNPRDNLIWGPYRVPVTTLVAPGGETTLAFTVKAPRTPGVHNFQWRMVQDGVEWFGEPTPNVPVAVTAG